MLAKEAAGENRVPKWLGEFVIQDAAQVSEMDVWIAKVTQYANHFPVDDRFVRHSTADSSLKKKCAGKKRKCQFFSPVDSASSSINQAERMLKCPKVSAVLERLRGRLAEAAC